MSYFANNKIAKAVGQSLKNQSNFQSFAGTDISVIAYLPVNTKNSLNGISSNKFKKFAEIQTISISSTRSVSPVRVLGRSSPLAYTRGARTFAGTLVFASLNHDVFQDIYDLSILESSLYHSTSLVSDQLPPFNIVITAANEKGAAAMQAVFGITLVNYGTVYSIDDLYTEVTYSYVAEDVTPFTNMSLSAARGGPFIAGASASEALKTLSDLAEDSTHLYPIGSQERFIQRFKTLMLYGQKSSDPVIPDIPAAQETKIDRDQVRAGLMKSVGPSSPLSPVQAPNWKSFAYANSPNTIDI
jgi:hypothetical protein